MRYGVARTSAPEVDASFLRVQPGYVLRGKRCTHFENISPPFVTMAKRYVALLLGLWLVACAPKPHLTPTPVPLMPTATSRTSLSEPVAIPPTLLPEPVAAAPTSPPRSSGVKWVWRTPLGGPINWRPQWLRGSDGRARLIVVPASGPVTALDPREGTILWQFSPPARLWDDSVTVVGDAVLVGSAGGMITLLDGATGTIRWQQLLQREPLPGLEARSQAVSAHGVVYVPTAGVGTGARVLNPALRAPLIALDMTTGTERWRFTADGYLLRAPFVTADGRLYVGASDIAEEAIEEGGVLRIYALDAADGSLYWVYESHDGLLKSLWAGDEVLVFVAYRDFLVGLEIVDGRERYRYNTGNWVQSFAVFPELRAPSGLPVLAYGSANAFLNVVDPADARFLWRYNLEGPFNYPIGNAVQVGETVYFISQRGELYALAATTGTLRWRRPTGLEARDGIAVGEGFLFVGSVDGAVYGFRLLD